ncbi:MAG: SLC13 family permease [Candidatus Zixiibacteriota bacterium]
MSKVSYLKYLSRRQTIGLFLGPVLAVVILFGTNLNADNPAVTRTAAAAVLMAVWWVTEAIPIPATALLPVALFPLMGIMDGKEVAAMYFNNVIFLFIGGFIMALAMQRWRLHKRIALKIILLIGISPGRLLLGFMMATGFLSMWISNTAAAMMMVPIAMAIITKLKENFDSTLVRRFSVGLLIGIAYASSIGGMATLIGTPPNLVFMRIFQMYFPEAPEITFAEWFIFGVPFAMVFLAIAWGLLMLLFVPKRKNLKADIEIFKQEYRELGKMRYEEAVVLMLFCLMAILWLFRNDINLGGAVIPGWSGLMPQAKFIDDGTVAILIAVLLFIVPSRSDKHERLMNWETAQKLHWGIVILFGGGFALAGGFEASGLSVWLGGKMTGLSGFPPLLLILTVCLLLTFLTELTSNTATTQMILPILASLAVAVKVHPLLLMIPATLSASCAFMLPVATPPNAIVFGSGEINMPDMIKSGFILNLAGAIVITIYIYLVGTAIFNIQPGVMPDWSILK